MINCEKCSKLCLLSDSSNVSTWIPKRTYTICGFSTQQRWKSLCLLFLLFAMCHNNYFASRAMQIRFMFFSSCGSTNIWMKSVLFHRTEWGNLLPAVYPRIRQHLAESAAAGFRQCSALVVDCSRFRTTPESAPGGAAAGNREVPDNRSGQVRKGKEICLLCWLEFRLRNAGREEEPSF